jgi:plasmid stabilization system protein ParE
VTRPYDLTRSAEEDLIAIWTYSEARWSGQRADNYLKQLDRHFHALADGDALCRDLGDIHPDLESRRCEHHVAFLVRQQGRPIIIAVLHEKMDLLVRLKARL